MCQCIEKVVQLAIATFSKKTPQETAKKNLDLLIAQTNKLTNVDVGLEHCSVFDSSPSRNREVNAAPVTYIPVVENQHISMGIFVIREGQNIPLHDHPNMHGVIKCIAGKLNITSFSKLDRVVATPERVRRSPSLLEKIKYGQLFPAEQGSTVTIEPDSVCCMLSPTNSNVHKIESVGGPAAFLDILAPPYNIRPPDWAEDQEERDCHYFRVLSGTDISPETSHSWLLMCDPPTSFYCDTEPYRGPEIQIDD